MARRPQDATAKEQASISLGHEILDVQGPKWTRCGSFSSNSNDSAVFCSNHRLQEMSKRNEAVKRNRNSSGSSSSSNLSYQSDKDAKKAADAEPEEVKVEGFPEYELKQEAIGRLAFPEPTVVSPRHNLRRNIRKKKCSCDCNATCTTVVMRRYKEVGEKTVKEETVISRKVQCVDDPDCEEPYSPGKGDSNKKRRSEVEKLYDSLHEIEWAKNFSPDNILRQINVRQAASCSMFGRSIFKLDDGQPKCPKRQKGIGEDAEIKGDCPSDEDVEQVSRATRSFAQKNPLPCNQNETLNCGVKSKKFKSQAIPENPPVILNGDDACAINPLQSSATPSSPASPNNNNSELHNGLIPNNSANDKPEELISENSFYSPNNSTEGIGAEVEIDVCSSANSGLPCLISVKDCSVPDKVAASEDVPPVLEPCISYQVQKVEEPDILKDCMFEKTKTTPKFFAKAFTNAPGVKEEPLSHCKQERGDQPKSYSCSRPVESIFLFGNNASSSNNKGCSPNSKKDPTNNHFNSGSSKECIIGSNDSTLDKASVLQHISKDLVNFAGNILPKLEHSRDSCASKTSSHSESSNPNSEKYNKDFHVKGFVMFQTCNGSSDCNSDSITGIESNLKDCSNPISKKDVKEGPVEAFLVFNHECSYSNSESSPIKEELHTESFEKSVNGPQRNTSTPNPTNILPASRENLHTSSANYDSESLEKSVIIPRKDISTLKPANTRRKKVLSASRENLHTSLAKGDSESLEKSVTGSQKDTSTPRPTNIHGKKVLHAKRESLEKYITDLQRNTWKNGPSPANIRSKKVLPASRESFEKSVTDPQEDSATPSSTNIHSKKVLPEGCENSHTSSAIKVSESLEQSITGPQRDTSTPRPTNIHSKKVLPASCENLDVSSVSEDSKNEMVTESFIPSVRSPCHESEGILKGSPSESLVSADNCDTSSENKEDERESPTECDLPSRRLFCESLESKVSEHAGSPASSEINLCCASSKSPKRIKSEISEKTLSDNSLISSERTTPCDKVPKIFSKRNITTTKSSVSTIKNTFLKTSDSTSINNATDKELSCVSRKSDYSESTNFSSRSIYSPKILKSAQKKSTKRNRAITTKRIWDKSMAEYLNGTWTKDAAHRIRNKYLFLRKRSERSKAVVPKYLVTRKELDFLFNSPEKNSRESSKRIFKCTITDLSALQPSCKSIEKITDDHSPFSNANCDKQIANEATGSGSSIFKARLEIERKKFEQLNGMELYKLPRREELEEESDPENTEFDQLLPETPKLTIQYQTIDVHRHADYVQMVLKYTHGNKSYFTRQSLCELCDVVKQANRDPQCSMLVLNGIGQSFSLGLDIDPLLGPQRSKEAKEIAIAIKEFIEAISEFKKPFVVIVNGEARGLAVTLLCHADIILASELATFSLPQTKLGYFPEGGATLTLPRAVGNIAAMNLIVGCRTITAREAQSINLVSEVYQENKIPSEILANVRLLSRLPSIETTKAMLNLHFRPQLLSVLETEVKILPPTWLSDSCQEAMRASRRTNLQAPVESSNDA